MEKPISGIDFIELFNQPGNDANITIEDYIIQDEVKFESSNYFCKSVKIINCHFLKGVLFIKVDLNLRLVITKCIFDSNLTFNTCSGKSHSALDPLNVVHRPDGIISESENLIIDNCTCDKVYINSNRLGTGVKIKNETTIDSIEIYDMKSEGNLSFEKVTIKSKCDIHTLHLNDLSFSKSEITPIVRFTNNILKSYTIIECKFKNDVFIWYGFIEQLVIINNNIFEEDLHITALRSNEESRLSMIGDKFNKGCNIVYYDVTNKLFGGCNNIYIKDCTSETGIEINGLDSNNKLSPIKTVTIDASNLLNGKISILNFKILELFLRGTNNNSHIIFQHIQVTLFSFSSFSNFSDIQFFNISGVSGTNPVLQIKDSYLGKTQFLNSDLNSFSNFEITNSVLSDIIASGVKWFNTESINKWIKMSKYDLLKNQRELCRQLKYAMDGQGDVLQSLVFRSDEMKAYRKQLWLDKGDFKTWGDIIITTLNRSNSYGTNWLKPAFFCILLTLLTYGILVVGISSKISWGLSLNISDIRSTYQELCLYSYAIPSLFNPVHSLDKVFVVKENNLKSFYITIIDSLYKIGISYLIFQTVAAFRKHSK